MIKNINILCLNYGGMVGKDKILRIKLLKVELKLDIIVLVEVCANESRITPFCSKLSKGQNWAAIAVDGYSGGIIITWQRRIGRVIPIAISKRALHLIISSLINDQWVMATIYNAQLLNLQQLVQKELSHLASINILWVIMGDFNAITSIDEHKSSSFHYYAIKASLFNNFISDNDLIDMGFFGLMYSCYNG